MLTAMMLVLCVLTRLIPHPPNFTPVGAMSVFAGRTLPRGLAALLMMALLLVSDGLLAWYKGYAWLSTDTLCVYVAYLAQIQLGYSTRSFKAGALTGATLGAFVFFFASNFGVWAFSGMYARTGAGLVDCFVAALPFFPATLISNVLGALVLNAIYRFSAAHVPADKPWIWVGANRLSSL